MISHSGIFVFSQHNWDVFSYGRSSNQSDLEATSKILLRVSLSRQRERGGMGAEKLDVRATSLESHIET